MSRRVSCPGCDATLKVAEEYVGRALVCSKCRTEFRLPPTADDASPSPRKKPDALSGGATRSQPPKPNPKPKEELRGPSVDRARRLREDHRKRGRRGNDTPVILGMEKTILVSSRLDYLSDEESVAGLPRAIADMRQRGQQSLSGPFIPLVDLLPASSSPC